MEKLFEFTYKGSRFIVQQTRYGNGAPALLIKESNGEPYCTLTVNLFTLPSDGCFYIKTWSENEEIADFLRTSEFFEDTGERIATGFVQAEVWRRK